MKSPPKYQRGYLSLIVQGGMAAASLFSGSKKRKAQNKARRQQQQINRIKNFQAWRGFMDNFLQAQAVSQAQALMSGAQDSSYAMATSSSQATQARRATTEMRQMAALGESASANLNRAARYGMQSDLYAVGAEFAGSESGGDALDTFGKKIGIGS